MIDDELFSTELSGPSFQMDEVGNFIKPESYKFRDLRPCIILRRYYISQIPVLLLLYLYQVYRHTGLRYCIHALHQTTKCLSKQLHCWTMCEHIILYNTIIYIPWNENSMVPKEQIVLDLCVFHVNIAYTTCTAYILYITSYAVYLCNL